MAARSRGPPRPTTRRESARARSGAAASRERVSARAAASPAKHATASSRRAIAAGSVSGAASRCASRREPAAVTVRSMAVEQRAAPLAGTACASIRDWRGSPGRSPGWRRRFAQRRRQRRTLAELRALDIGDAGRRGGQLQPRQRAEGFAGRDREERRSAAARRSRRRTRRGSAASPPAASATGREIGVAVERVGDDDLARLEPRDLGGKRARSHSVMRNSPVEISIQASAKRPRRRRRARARSPAGNCCAARRAACPRSACRRSRAARRRGARRSCEPRFLASAGSSSCSQTATRWPSAISRCRYSSARITGTPHSGMSRPRYLPRLVSTMPSAREAISASSKNIS